MEDFEPKDFWNKTSEELTVKDCYKIAATETAVTVGVGVAFLGILYGVATIVERRAARKARKEAQKKTEVQ